MRRAGIRLCRYRDLCASSDSGQIASLFTGISDLAGDDCITAQRSIQLADPIVDKLLVVGVSRTLSIVYAAWNRDASIKGCLFGALVLASALGLSFYQRRQHAYGRLIDIQEAERNRAEAALRESGERHAQVAAQSRTYTWELDSPGMYTFLSPITEAIVGYHPAELVGKMHFYDLAPGEDRDAVRTAGPTIIKNS